MYASPQLDRVLGLLREVFGDDLIGAYLHGSCVLGGMSPTSDLDVLAVVRRGSTDAERRRLVERLLALTAPPGPYDPAEPDVRPIELTIVVESEVRPWRFPPRMEFQYGDWERTDYERGVIPAARPNPDLAMLIEIARKGSASLVGPDPRTFFDPIPLAHLRAAMVEGLDGLLEDLAHDTRNVLLTLARIRMTLETGEIHSKAEAAEWLADRLPPNERAVMTRAAELYHIGKYGPFTGLEDRIGPLAERLVAEIRASA